ncbi:hypothetical protein DFH27DRAFT_524404 [Peziza echinospora]|nr:hypothetical protein DFH27DRAFT_524404 [Peziza echinospora]
MANPQLKLAQTLQGVAEGVGNIAADVGIVANMPALANANEMNAGIQQLLVQMREFREQMRQVQEQLGELRRQGSHLPVLLHNSTRGLDGRLAYPNDVDRENLPETRADLYHMDAMACRQAAAALALPALRGRSSMKRKRNQIAEYLGVKRME